jgi:hypothetical protein
LGRSARHGAADGPARDGAARDGRRVRRAAGGRRVPRYRALDGGGQAGAGNSDFSDLSPFGNAGSTGASGNAAFQDSGNDDASLQDASFDEEDDFGGDAAGDLGGDDWA